MSSSVPIVPVIISAVAASASALTALLSLSVTIYIYRSTRKLVKPFERPLLAIISGEPGVGVDGKIGYAVTIKNSGQRPAANIRFRTRAAPENNLAELVFLPEWAPAHDYIATGEMKLMLWPPSSFSEVTMMQVEVSYTDGISNTDYAGENYWLVIFPGAGGAVTAMNRQQRDKATAAWGGRWLASDLEASSAGGVTAG